MRREGHPFVQRPFLLEREGESFFFLHLLLLLTFTSARRFRQFVTQPADDRIPVAEQAHVKVVVPDRVAVDEDLGDRVREVRGELGDGRDLRRGRGAGFKEGSADQKSSKVGAGREGKSEAGRKSI